MKLASISNFDRLNAEQQYQYIMLAKANGLIDDNYSIAQVSNLYKRDQLSKIGIDPDVSEEGANAYLRLNQLADLAKKNLLGQEFSSLFELANVNPILASNLADQLFTNGYMTLDERNQAALNNINNGDEEGTSWLRGAVTDIQFWRDSGMDEDQDPNEFSKRAFHDYYKQVKKTRESTAVGRAEKEANPEKWERETLEEARRTYLNARNQNIYADIQKQIDAYWDQEADKRGELYLQEINNNDTSPEASNQISQQFNQLVNGYTESVEDDLGNVHEIVHNGSNYWRAYQGSVFDDFGLDEQKKVIAKYNAYKDLLGSERADMWLENEMQSWVSDHQSGLDRVLNTANAFSNTILNNVGPRMLSFGVWGLAKLGDYALQGYQAVTGQEVTTNLLGDIASIISTGKDQMGRSPDEVDENGNLKYPEYRTLSHQDVLGWGPLGNWGNLSFLRQDYLSKVDAYNTWDSNAQQRAETNGGISGNEQYVLKPGQTSPDFWSAGTVQDVLGMTSQIVGQAAALYLYGGGGGSFASLAEQVSANGAKALLTKEALQTTVAGFKDATITAAPIAESYAYGTYQQTFNGAMQAAAQGLQQDVEEAFMLKKGSGDYEAQREAAYQAWLHDTGNKENRILRFDSQANRDLFNQQYDQQEYKKLYDEMQKSREQDINMMAQSAALDAYMTSFLGEYSKYGMLNAIMNPLKVLKSPNLVIASELRTNAYGKLTQNAAGRFTNEGIPLLGVKKWTVTNPKVIGSMNVAKNALISGGLSNYTDEMTTGFAMGYGLSRFNSEYLRHYDPEAYANTWHGGSSIGQFMDAVGEGISGAVKAGMTEQAYHAFEIGALGGLFAPRLAGRNQMKEQYRQENQEHYDATGEQPNLFKKFRQGFNTYVTGAIGEYEVTRFGMKESAKTVNAYNTALDLRDQLFTELAALHQGIANSAMAASRNDFAASAAAEDALAMKMLYNEHRLSSNPLHQISNQQMQTDIAQLHYIAQGSVSDAEKERMVLEALNTSQQTKQGPISQQMKDQTWAEIQRSAKRMTDFMDDYQAEEQRLLETDASLGTPKNYPILTQRAELKAQELRLRRDMEQLAKDSGIQIDHESRGSSYGEMTDSQRETLTKGAQDTIDRLQKQREKEITKLEELNEKIANEKDAAKIEQYEQDALQARANITGIGRQIDELNQGIYAIENSELLLNSSKLTSDAVILDDMLSNPEQYSDAQQQEIEAFRAEIGPLGEVYVRELAKLQDQLTDNLYSQQAIQANPEDFLALHSAYAQARQEARNRAIYEQELRNRFNQLAQADLNLVGIQAAISLSPDQFTRFQQEYPQLSPLVSQYAPVNTAFDTLQKLFNPSDKALRSNVLSEIASLMDSDLEYVRDNGSQGVADMLEFLKSQHAAEPVTRDAIDNLLTDFKRAESISQSTVAYTEYKIKKMAEQSRELADQLVKQLEEAEKARQQQAQAGEAPANPNQVEGGTLEDIDIDFGDEAPSTPKEETAPEAKEDAETAPEEAPASDDGGKEPPATNVTEAPAAPEELPAGVTRNSDGNLETMSAEEQAQQLGISEVKEDSMVDDSGPKPQDVTDQQEEVHGSYFNMYESQALNHGELVPYTEGPVYEWLDKEGIKLGNIIDDELHQILQANPRVQLMKVKKDGSDENVASNIFLVVEYTDKVSKHHLPTNGGVITSGGKQYLIVGTMWNTKAQDGTEAANLMQTTRTNLQRKGVSYFDANPSERFFVDPDVHTEVTTFYSGHIVHTINEESQPHTLQELIDQHNATHTSANQMNMADLGFGVITMKEGFYPVGPHSADKIHAPQKQTVDKYGQVYVLVPAANGEIVPIFINPVLLSELRDSQLKQRIDTVLIPQLLSSDYYMREQAISELCQLLCISGSITNPEGKGILIGTEKIPTVSLVNGKSIIKTFDVSKADFTIEEFRQALYSLNPRINLSLSNLAQPGWVQRYDEAGALMTDATKLGTYGGKFYVAPINPATGQPIRTEQKAKPVETSSDYTRAQAAPTMLPVGGQTYVLRDGKWVHQSDGSPVTDKAEQTQVIWAHRVYTGKAQLAFRQGAYDYYVMDVETDSPKVVAYNLATRSYQGVPDEFANQIVAERRAELEKARAEETAKAILEEEAKEPEAPVEEAKEPETSTQPETTQTKTQEKLARVEEAIQNPDVQIWSDKAEDNVAITVTSGGFSGVNSGRLKGTAGDYRQAVSAKIGDIVSNGRAVVKYKDRDGNTYIEKVNAEDGDVKSAIVFPIGGRGGDNFTIHFCKTLTPEERDTVISAVANTDVNRPDLTKYINTLLEHYTPELRYSDYLRNPEKLEQLRADAGAADAESNVSQEAPKPKNDFQLNDISQQEKYSVDDILDSSEDTMMEYADRIYEIIENKKATSERWANFNMEDMTAELQRLGIEATNIDDIESWIDNLENCE